MAAAAAATMAASVLFRRSASLLLSAKSVRRSSLRSLSSGNPKFRAFASALPQADAVCAAPAPAVDGYVADLIQFGAVHYDPVCRPTPPTATSKHLRIFKEVTASSVLRKRASIKGKTVREVQKTFRITDPGQFVEAGMCMFIQNVFQG